jgi:carbon dioxide concentrating mechanism protein CcmL
MLLARVKGLVVSSQKVGSLQGLTFRMIQAEDGSGRPLGEPLVAVDLMATRDGDLVFYIDAREAPKALPGAYGPIDACIVGLVDSAT